MADRYPFHQNHPQHGMISQPQHSNMVRFQGMPVWQQVPNPRIPFAEDQRQREYLKQQQKLRLMASTSNKAVSADKLIENLLDKKETFRPKSISVAPSNHQALPHSALPSTSMYVYQQTLPAEPNKVIKNTEGSDQFEQLPLWLKPKSPAVPPLYVQIWSIVQLESGLTDTTKVFQLLITSGLTSDVLGYIWGLANKKVPGQLTQQELYVALALVALAQSGCTFNNLSVLNLIPQPPIPKLNITNQNGGVSNLNTTVSQQGKMRREELNLQSHHGGLYNGMSLTHPMKAVKVVSEDEFTEFQSCTVSLDSSVKSISSNYGSDFVNNVTSIPHSNNLPKTSSHNESTSQLKFPSVMIVGNTSQARGIGSRLANHSLGTPKPSKVKHHKHHHHHHHRSNVHSNAPVSSSLDDDFTEFQQAKDTVNVDNTEVFLKSTKPSASNTYVLKESAIRSDQKPTKLSELDTKCTHSKRESVENNSSVPPQLKMNVKEPALPLESKIVSAVKELNKISISSKELMSVEEDKYSALRNLTFASTSNNEDERCDIINSSDDFGDFLSAEPSVGNDSFLEITSRETNVKLQQPPDISAWNLPSPQVTEFQADWAAFDSSLSNHETITTINREEKGSDSPLNKNFGASDLEIMQIENLQIGNISQSNNAHTSSTRVVSSLNLQDILMNDYQDTSCKNTANTDLFPTPGEKNVQYPIEHKDYMYDNDASTFVFKTINDDDDDDDFGDFVGPDTITEENSGSNNKDLVFDGQSMLGVKDTLCDSQSVSSLELPPLTMSRHGSLPSLDLKVFSSGAEQSESQRSWNFSPQVVERQLGEWLRCLNSCLNLLQAAQKTFASITSESVLEEVLNVHEGKEYLYNLREVYGVSERIRQSFKQTSTDSKEMEKVFNEIDAVWSDLTVLLRKADISAQLQMPSMEMTENTVCGICLANLYGGGNTNPLEYSGNVYHASCANLWVNCVESSLPALHGSLL